MSIKEDKPKTFWEVMAEKRERKYQEISFLSLGFKIFFLFPCFLYSILEPEKSFLLFQYFVSAKDFLVLKIFIALFLSFYSSYAIKRFFQIIGFLFSFLDRKEAERERKKYIQEKREREKQFSTKPEYIRMIEKIQESKKQMPKTRVKRQKIRI